MKRSVLFSILITVFSYLVLQSVATAATITVTLLTDRFDNTPGVTGCSLREAIESVNNGMAFNDGCAAEFTNLPFSNDPTNPDVINLIAGDYVLDLNGNNEDDNVSGDLDVTKAVIITGAGSLQTTITASGFAAADKDRVLNFLCPQCFAGFPGSLIPVTLSGMTIRDGDVRELGQVGGGINAGIFFLTLDDVIVTNNFAVEGGGIFTGQCVLVLTNSQVLVNEAISEFGNGNGGGISAALSFLEMDSSTVAGNRTNGGGGGIFVFGQAVITNSTVSGNQAVEGLQPTAQGVGNFGGGIAAINLQLLMINSTVSGNTATFGGGGIALLQSGGAGADVTITGGGATIIQGLYNVTLARNTVTANGGVGGGICNNCNLAFTEVGGTGDGYVVSNTLIAENDAFTGPDCFGPYLSAGFNLIGDVVSPNVCFGFDLTGVNGDKVGGNGNAIIDPMITDLQANGGPTLTHGLIQDSQAIDMGDPAGCMAPTIPSDPLDLVTIGTGPAAELLRDQRDFPRPIDGDQDGTPRCDIGAFEFQVFGFEMTKVDNTGGDEVPVGDTFDYVITVTNNGPGTASNVTIDDPLPANVSLVSVTPSQGSCTGIGNVVGCNLGDLASGESATVTVTVLAEVAGTFTNIATLNLTNPSQQTVTLTAQVTTTIGGVFVEGSGIHCGLQRGTASTGTIPGLALILLGGISFLFIWKHQRNQ